MDQMLRQIENEAEKIADKGLSINNLDAACKLIDMWYHIKKAESLGGGYSQRYSNDNSYGRHYVRGHYSRDGYDGGESAKYDEYMSHKRDYRNNHSYDCKAKMVDTLEMYMDDFARKMEELAKDADCQEERDTINKYIRKIKEF